ncbi:hypothetical protein [uncultured Marivirga sp.]|uniref:hypothetical protein n=1 Tax=uncultured Marivirga sp. TaxID=1123707 RepID=UPI0030EC8D36|tara:strand:+ start:33991 stop:35034 length:1044 start_codon:yes stop_codon:yes gene_type:complete
MKRIFLIYSYVSISLIMVHSSVFSQEIENMEELYFAHDFYNVKKIYFLNNELSLGLQFKEGGYDILILNKENINQKNFKISDLFDNGFNQGRIRLYDVWQNNDSSFVLSTAMGDFELNSSDISIINRDFQDLKYLNTTSVNAYKTPFLTVGYDLIQSKAIKKKYGVPQFTLVTKESDKIIFDKPERVFETIDTYFDLKDWNIFYDRDRLFTPFIDVVSDKELLINYPKFRKATYYHYERGSIDFYFDIDDLNNRIESFYLFYDSRAKYFLASVKIDDIYKLFIYNNEENDFVYWDEMTHQPLGINSIGVYYQIKVPKSNKTNHYIKRFEKLNSYKILLDEIYISPDN